MKKVLVLGGSGMLGGMVVDVLSRDPNFQVSATVRSDRLAKVCAQLIPSCQWLRFDAETDDVRPLLAGSPFDAVINAIGIIKPYIKDDNPAQTERAVRINALFPHVLARAAEEQDVSVFQIATDCVYSGRDGKYGEAALHDALDVYGKSKSMGEVAAANMAHIRCSIIGPEPKAHVSLLDWFLGQAPGATVNGFTNHFWNGVTTLHYGKACAGIIKAGLILPQKLHLVPTATITKANMLGCFAQAYGRTDITVNYVEAGTVIDRTLQTTEPELNRRVWQAAGYETPPTVPDMIAEMGRFDFRLVKLD